MTKEKIKKEISLLNDNIVKLHKDLDIIEQKEHKELLKNRAKILRSYIGKKVVIKTWSEYVICVMLKVTRSKNEYSPFRVYVKDYISFNRTQVDCISKYTKLECLCDSEQGWIDASGEEDDIVLYDEHPVKAQFDKILNFMKNF